MSDSDVSRIATHMLGMLEANRPASMGQAVLDVLSVYEAMRSGMTIPDAQLRAGLTKGFDQWRLAEAKGHAEQQQAAEANAQERNEEARTNTVAYRDHVRDESASFLGRHQIGSGGHAVILLCSIFSDFRTGDSIHDQTLAAGLGLAFDLWAERERVVVEAMKKTKAQA